MRTVKEKYAATLKKFTNDDGQWVYHGQVLKKFLKAKSHFGSHCQEYCTCVSARIHTRLSWSKLQLFRDIIIMLGTQGWQKIANKHVVVSDDAEDMQASENPLDAIDWLVKRFKIPLEGAAAETSEIRGEFEAMVSYATQFISFSTMKYQLVWWRLVHAPNSSEWSNLSCKPSFLHSSVKWEA